MPTNRDPYRVSEMTINRVYISPNTGNPAIEIHIPSPPQSDESGSPYQQYDYKQLAAIALPMARKLGLRNQPSGFGSKEVVVESGFTYSMYDNSVRLALINSTSATGHRITQNDLVNAFNQTVAEAKARAGHRKTASLDPQDVTDHSAPNITNRSEPRQIG